MNTPSIAVIGMNCVYPGALSLDEFWQNVLAGRRFFRRMPDERLPMADYYDPDPTAPGKTYSTQMAVISGWSFDPTEFGIPPVTANVSDIVHWLTLYTARKALEDSGLDLAKLDKSQAGVILGNSGTGEFFRSYLLRNRWPYIERSVRRAVSQTYGADDADALVEAIKHFCLSPLPEITEDYLAGSMGNVIAGRVCNYFDFRGGGYVVDGACSSSLLAVTNACNAIVAGEMEVALAGGVDVSLDPFEIVGFAKTKALAKDDIRPYDERGAGMITGEGCGVVVLAREDYARAAGCRIYATIKGWGISSDGSGGITAPKVEGQALALQRAYKKAGYPISSIGLIEGHGTGTSLGDKTEIGAIRSVLDDSPGKGNIRIGSIKANIGHCKAAAGVAAFIKATLSLQRKVIPPTVSCQRPNPAFGVPLSELRPEIRGAAWAASEDGPRRASVSAMGFGGINTHITLEEANPQDQPSPEDLELLGSHQGSELLLLAGAEPGDLRDQVETLLPVAERICRAELTDLAAALAAEKPAGAMRLAIVSDSPWQLAEQLRTVAEKLAAEATLAELDDPGQGIFAGTAREKPRLAALFPGQGSQRLNMGEHWRGRYPFARELAGEMDAGFSSLQGGSLEDCVLRDLWGADEATRAGWRDELRQTRLQQPAIVAASMLALESLEFFGLKPDVAVGHSLGEISALCAGGAFDPATSVRIAALRGQAMTDIAAPNASGMAALGAPAEQVTELLERHGLPLVISNYNSPRQTVVSGSSEAVEQCLGLCKSEAVRAIRLPVSHAFHSDFVAPAAEAFRAALESVAFAPPAGTVYSTATGRPLEADSDIRELLAGHIRQPVLFSEAVSNIQRECTPDLWIEVGPGAVLSSLVRDTLGADNVECLPTDLENEDNFHHLNRVLARAYVLGVPVKTERIFAERFSRPFDYRDYRPELLVNPCERPVPEPETPLALSGGLPAGLLPADGDPAIFSDYLQRRGEFLSDLIALDFKHQSGDQPVRPAASPGKAAKAPAAATKTEPEVVDQESALQMAIDWIVQRTGFSPEFVQSEKRLRDDLNLDSIKAGELVLTLSRAMGKQAPLDPGVLANASIVDLVTELGGHQQAAQEGDEEELDSTIRSLHIRPMPAPLEQDRKLPLAHKEAGPVWIVTEPDCPRAFALARSLEDNGFSVLQFGFRNVPEPGTGEKGPAALAIILPEEERMFLDCPAQEFADRVEGLATDLFTTLRSALSDKVAADSGFRCLVLRPAPADDRARDMDAGAALLKTLSLEHKKLHWKSVTMPDSWSAEKFAQTAVLEFGTASDRIEFHYDADELRTSPTAVPLETPSGDAPRIGGTDVILVSGGGKGITFEMALELGRKTGTKLALLGSSPPPEPSADAEGDELARNLKRMGMEGIRHLYLQCDVTDAEAVAGVVKDVERNLGTVTGLLHGAGISKFAEFRSMDMESYLHCIRIKAHGLYNLLSALSLEKLKTLHVISSVLGRTGMARQADYTFANAWLDGAVESLRQAHPGLHALTLGYSVWEEIGIGAKSGSIDILRSGGVASIPVAEGTASYWNLASRAWSGSTFVVTGTLGATIDAKLYPPPVLPKMRFLEKPVRFLPGVELVAEASLSHVKDLYIPEHVFDGTPMFPGVMALEAMTEAAMACCGRQDLPVLRAIRFNRPLIIPENAEVRVRTMAYSGAPDGETTLVRVAMSSEADGFEADHFQVECVFGLPDPPKAALANCPELPAPLPVDPEEFSPTPLFQGKFFRRISGVLTLTTAEESITRIRVPEGAQYFDGGSEQTLASPSPAVRDACLQSGALIMPPGYLPEGMEEIRFYRRPLEGEELTCWTRATLNDDGAFTADLAIFDADGNLVETINGLSVRAPATETGLGEKPVKNWLELARLAEQAQEQLIAAPLTLAIVSHGTMKADDLAELTAGEQKRIRDQVSESRQGSSLANTLAARRAVLALARNTGNEGLTGADFTLAHSAEGKPEVVFGWSTKDRKHPAPSISLSDVDGMSLALAGSGPVGIDMEAVSVRDAETWRGLLGPDGYGLALSLSQATEEAFDISATRVWTLLEAGKKANGLKRMVPAFVQAQDDARLLFRYPDLPEMEIVNVVCTKEDKDLLAVSLVIQGQEGGGHV
ncbi:type I polyketide synthase [uncultured Desulfuromonas sp.]|uniref:type I polyketide synthase n=1 Tax=uncultured Desulfuromonas sp. TaxID=181013 RepID=UPI00262F8ACA|nr:type I polyketide synthase [uncultured Desulfuromonas sp.]